jgi:hypothetical protein
MPPSPSTTFTSFNALLALLARSCRPTTSPCCPPSSAPVRSRATPSCERPCCPRTRRQLGRGSFEGMVAGRVPLVSLLLACGQIGWRRHGRSVHAFCVQRFLGMPLSLGNTLVDMYVKCGDFAFCREGVCWDAQEGCYLVECADPWPRSEWTPQCRIGAF